MATKSSTTTPAEVPAWKTIVVILSLLLLWPLGLILMLVWMKWPVWVKIVVPLVTAFVAFIIFSITSAFLLVLINPKSKVDMARMAACDQRCKDSTDKACFETCFNSFKISPTPASY